MEDLNWRWYKNEKLKTTARHFFVFCYNAIMPPTPWASARKLFYTISVIAFFALVAVGVYFSQYYRAPTCTDGKQNQNEEGVDCGGSCAVICPASVADPIVLWNRSFPVARGVYNAVAYIENPNANLGVKMVTYRFKLYDEENILVAERVGKAFIAPNERFAIFEPRINTGERIPKRTFFEFIKFSDWTKLDKEMPKILVRGEKSSSIGTSSRVDATLQNSTIVDISDVNVVAIVYDKNNNAMAVSATKVDKLKADSSYNVAFTWDVPFLPESSPWRVEVIPRVDLFGLVF
jgi:hypothetical protein